MMGFARSITDEERAYILAKRDELSLLQIGRDLGRSSSFITKHAKADGWLQNYYLTEAGQQRIRELVPLGWCNRCISREVNLGRKEIRRWRTKLGLPQYAGNGQSGCTSCSQRTAARTREQLAKAGLNSLAEVRVKAFRDYAAAAGWPADLRPRHVQILDALYHHGPHTRRQLAERLGMPWKGSRKSLVSNDPEGSYLAHLQARGLVMRCPRRVPVADGGKAKNGKRSGKTVYLYMLPLHVQPQSQNQHTESV